LLWPWPLLLLILVVGGLIAAWLLTRDSGGGKPHKQVMVVAVPSVVSLKERLAVMKISRAGLVPHIRARTSSLAAGTVFAEQPGAGSRVTRGSAVTLVTSVASVVVVPDVVGKKAAAAVSALRAKGLSVETSRVVSSKPDGTVVSQSPVAGSPVAGSKVAKGSTAAIRISHGLVRVPDTVGQTSSVAAKIVRAAASLGPNPGPQQVVPNVIGLSPSQAEARLRAAGFDVQQLTQTVQDRSKDGIVVDEQPGAGKKAPAGSTVTIYVGSFFET
jgi:beta-lactam-binding protein with PASTA domain